MQDARSGEVLTLAYMNEESLLLTLETREIHLYSRSRREIWRKGATSGNIQRVRQIRYDCDGDALVALVDPAGPACHTGERSCFYRDLEGTADPGVDAPGVPGEPAPLPYEALAALERTLVARQRKPPDGQLHGRAARGPEARRRQGPRGGAPRSSRRSTPSPRSGSPRRAPTSSTTWRCCCSRAASRWPRCCTS